jgi:hypothetical protein
MLVEVGWVRNLEVVLNFWFEGYVLVSCQLGLVGSCVRLLWSLALEHSNLQAENQSKTVLYRSHSIQTESS